MKVGLVLGAGGVKGIAWLTGALEAVYERTGWDPADADYVVGTSAGALIGSLLVARGQPGGAIVGAEGTGGDLQTDDVAPWPPRDLDRLPIFRPHRGLPRPHPGSLRLALATLRNPRAYTPATVYSAWLPAGPFSIEPVKQAIRGFVPNGWSTHPNLWIVACDYETGRRVVFGRAGAPKADLADAVAASCAIPGFFHPVRIEGRRYVDGGMYSTSNLGVLREQELDVAICLNPTSTLHPPSAWNPLERVATTWRTESGRRLGRETRRLRDRGTEVVLIQPTGADLEVIGPNMMSRRRHREVIETSRRTTAAQLDEPRWEKALALLAERGTANHRGSGTPAGSA